MLHFTVALGWLRIQESAVATHCNVKSSCPELTITLVCQVGAGQCPWNTLKWRWGLFWWRCEGKELFRWKKKRWGSTYGGGSDPLAGREPRCRYEGRCRAENDSWQRYSWWRFATEGVTKSQVLCTEVAISCRSLCARVFCIAVTSVQGQGQGILVPEIRLSARAVPWLLLSFACQRWHCWWHPQYVQCNTGCNAVEED